MTPHSAQLSGGVEQCDDIANRAAHLVESLKERERRNRATFAEKYYWGDLNICLRRVDGRPPYDGVILKALPNTREPKTPFGINRADCGPDRHHFDPDEATVFPDIVECVQPIKVRVPSRPRFQAFDDILIGNRKPTYLFTSGVFPVPEPDLVTTDGKLRVFRISGAIALGQGVGKEIKTTAEAVDNQSCLGVDDCGRTRGVGEFISLLSVLRVKFFHDLIWGYVPPSLYTQFQNWQLGVGPFNSGYCV